MNKANAILKALKDAEGQASIDPPTALFKIRFVAESLTDIVAAEVGETREGFETQEMFLTRLEKVRIIAPSVARSLHELRIIGNKGVHQMDGTPEEAKIAVALAQQLVKQILGAGVPASPSSLRTKQPNSDKRPVGSRLNNMHTAATQRKRSVPIAPVPLGWSDIRALISDNKLIGIILILTVVLFLVVEFTRKKPLAIVQPDISQTRQTQSVTRAARPPTPGAREPEDPPNLVAITDVTNLRTGPGTEYPVLAKLRWFTQLEQLGDSKGRSGEQWFRVRSRESGKVGFVAGKNVWGAELTVPSTFTCGGPATEEALICGNFKLAGADRTLGFIYEDLLSLLRGDQQKELVQTQSRWVEERKHCIHANDPIMCLKDVYAARTRILLSIRTANPRPDDLVTLFLGAYRSDRERLERWTRFQQHYPAFRDGNPVLGQVDTPKGWLYRIRTCAFRRADAEQVCQGGRASGEFCAIDEDETAYKARLEQVHGIQSAFLVCSINRRDWWQR